MGHNSRVYIAMLAVVAACQDGQSNLILSQRKAWQCLQYKKCFCPLQFSQSNRTSERLLAESPFSPVPAELPSSTHCKSCMHTHHKASAAQHKAHLLPFPTSVSRRAVFMTVPWSVAADCPHTASSIPGPRLHKSHCSSPFLPCFLGLIPLARLVYVHLLQGLLKQQQQQQQTQMLICSSSLRLRLRQQGWQTTCFPPGLLLRLAPWPGQGWCLLTACPRAALQVIHNVHHMHCCVM